MSKRVVITGMGTVNPLANNIADTWQAIRNGKSGVGMIDRIDITDYAVKIGAQVKNFNPSDFMDRKLARKMCRFTHYGVAAARQAIDDADFLSNYRKERIGCIFGVGIGGFDTIEDSLAKIFKSGPDRVPPMTIPKMISNEVAGNVAIIDDLKGPNFVISTACASGTDALGHGLMMLRSGRVDAVVAGGAEAPIAQLGMAGFHVLQALNSDSNASPEKASRPFDKDRSGFVIAEGAAVVILEEYEAAKKRGAKIYGELAGYGASCDAYHLTAPDPEGAGAVQAMRSALDDGGITVEKLDYINAHGTSTPINDPMETKAIKTLCGDHAYKLKVSSTKSMHGHMIAAAGVIEAIICTLAMRDGFYPPTINLDNPDEQCDLDYVANNGVEGEINYSLSNSFGFGGHNAAVLLKKGE